MTFLLFMAWALCGCTTPYREPELDPLNATFPGLAQIVAAEPSGSVDLFIVHGMCHHDEVWARAWLNLVASSLGSTAKLDAPPAAEPAAKIKIYRATISLTKGTIRAHAIVWSGLTKPLKDQICYDQSNKSESCLLPSSYPPAAYHYKRAKLNALIKDDLLNDCFSDAVIYQGAARLSIVRQVQLALLASRAASVDAMFTRDTSLARASLANDSGLVVLSSSLGSKVFFDSILELTKLEGDDEAAGAKLRDSTRQVIMTSNQLPLLSLGDQDLQGLTRAAIEERSLKPGVFPPDPLDSLMRQRGLPLKKLRTAPQLQGQSTELSQPMLKVVAFTDPNDLLSYAVQGFYKQRNTTPSYEVIDVIVSNGSTVLGLFENPYAAHTGYGNAGAVMRRVACGQPVVERCP